MPRKMVWRRLDKPKEVRLKMPGAGLPRDVLRVSLETRDRELGEARIAMFRDLYGRLQFELLRARQEERFTTDELHRAYREGEAALKALLTRHEGRRLAPLIAKWQRSYLKQDRARIFRQVDRFLAAHGGKAATTACLTAANVEAFLSGLTSQQGRGNRKHAPAEAGKRKPREAKAASGGTRNRYRGSLSALATWLVKHGHLAVHPIAHKRVEKFAEADPRMPAPFTPDDYRGYLAAVTAERPDLRPVVLLLLHTAADLGEVLSRQAWHVELQSSARAVARVRFKRTKTRTPERTVPVDAEVANELRAHIAARGLKGEQPLFAEVTEDEVRRVHERARLAIGRPSLTIKDLRHVAAIAWVQAGVRIDRVSQLLGHASLSQTMVYVSFAPDTAEEADIARLGAAQLRGPAGVVSIDTKLDPKRAPAAQEA